ncbi:hypothetical protein C4588_01875 [Candidatus Parcubacteria bacterium]|nr:MAG: hypothetical protein C4588_01875 [Candidatus Parcubacteria bacterium]
MPTVKNFIELKKAIDNKEEEIIIDNPRIITLVKLLKNKWFVRLLYGVFFIDVLLATILLIVGIPAFFVMPPTVIVISPGIVILIIFALILLFIIFLVAMSKNYNVDISFSPFRLKLTRTK